MIVIKWLLLQQGIKGENYYLIYSYITCDLIQLLICVGRRDKRFARSLDSEASRITWARRCPTILRSCEAKVLWSRTQNMVWWKEKKCTVITKPSRQYKLKSYHWWHNFHFVLPLSRAHQNQRSTVREQNDVSRGHCLSQTAPRACKLPLASPCLRHPLLFLWYRYHCPLVWVLDEGSGSTKNWPRRRGREWETESKNKVTLTSTKSNQDCSQTLFELNYLFSSFCDGFIDFIERG